MSQFSQLIARSTPVLALFLLTAFILYIFVGYTINYRKLRQFKGPLLAYVSELWLFKAAAAGRMYLAIADALEEHGKREDQFPVGDGMLLTELVLRFLLLESART